MPLVLVLTTPPGSAGGMATMVVPRRPMVGALASAGASCIASKATAADW